jgi:hypothetical protein
MTAPELRSLVRSVLDGVEDEQRAAIVDALVARAARGEAGWRPSRPSQRIVDEVVLFAEAARRVGHADPDDVSAHLRKGTKAFLAGDHASARLVFEALIPSIAHGDIDLGQHEMVEEVLNVDVRATVAQYVTSVYTTTPLGERAKAVYDAIERVAGFASLADPIADMEGASAGALPELGLFLPRWVRRLERLRPSKDDWETAHEQWLREAVFRLDGVEGLERIARRTKRPQACLAWCEALVDRGDWANALRAFDSAATLVAKSHWRGDLLDGAALAAQHLGRPDVQKRLEAAWRGAPTMTRLLRWLVAGDSAFPTLRAKAKRAAPRCPTTAGRQLGLLRVLTGDVRAAAGMLSKAPGLGWSSADHPGHVLFPLFAMLLADGTPNKVSAMLTSNLESTCRDPLEALSEGVEGRPTLTTPSIVALIQDIRPGIAADGTDRRGMLDAMRVAAEKRIEEILTHSRRRHYGHAATLAASCLACAPRDGEQVFTGWIAAVQQKYSRRHAFRDELTRAMAGLGVSVAGNA